MPSLPFKKYGQLLLLLLSWNTLSGNNCDLPEIDVAYEQLYKSVDAARAAYALSLADSLLKTLEGMDEESCPIYLWIKYEKGEALEMLKEWDQALSIYHEVIRVAEGIKEWKLIAEAYISIARTHEFINRPDDCLRNLNIAREIIQEHKFYETFSRFAVRYASYHRIYDNRDSAVVYAEMAIGFGKRYEVKRSELDGHLLMGILTDDLNQSIFHFEEAVKIDVKRESYNGAAFQQLNIASEYHRAGKTDEAIKALKIAYSLAGQMKETNPGYYTLYQELHEFKQVLFEKQGLMDSALVYAKLSLEAERRATILTNQSEINQKEIAFAIEKEQTKLQLEQQRSFYLRWGLILVGVLLAGMILAYINNERKKRFIARQKDLISQKNADLSASLHKQSVLLSEVHHRVKNNLQLVMSLLTLKGTKLPESDIHIHFDDLASKVHSISLIHEQLYRAGEFDEVNIKEYFRDLTSHFKSLQSEENAFELNLETEEIYLNLETVLPLGIICSELISNSLKYARTPGKCLKLHISVKKENNKYSFTYKDNGPGYPDNSLQHKTNSMGSLLISSMVRQLKASSKTSNDNGASFTMNFHEKEVSQI